MVVSWLCLVEIPLSRSRCVANKQLAVSHSHSEADVLALDAGARNEGVPSVVFRAHVLELLQPARHNFRIPGKTACATQAGVLVIKTRLIVDYVPQLRPGPLGRTNIHIREDTEAVIKMVITRRRIPLRHAVRTHIVHVDWPFAFADGDVGVMLKQQLKLRTS